MRVPGPAQLLRAQRIIWVLLVNGFDELILCNRYVPGGRYLWRALPWNWLRHDQSLAVRLRRALEQLGPLFVKFGQQLSTRRDLLPEDFAFELAKLQDAVPPFPAEQAQAVLERAYGETLQAHFAHFEPAALASASVAQVHAATLHDGREIVLKVLRPGIERIIRRDVALMYLVAGILVRWSRDARRLRAVDVVREFERTLLDELDLVREGANAAQLRRNFADSEQLYVPEVLWDYSGPQVLALERIYGTPIDDLPALKRQGIDLRRLAENGVEIFFRQVFEHNFFHADMHAGNIFVSSSGRYLAVDFGIMGSLSQEDKRYLAENFVGFFNRDYAAVTRAHLRAGWVPADTREDQFEAAIRSVCEPIFDKPLAEISFGLVLVRLFSVARRFDMQVQPQLVLLQKTLLNIEGLGRELYPQLDLWRTAKPFLERWVQEQIGWRGLLRKSREELPRLGEALPEIPMMVHDVLAQLRDGNLRVTWQSDQLDSLHRQNAENGRALVRAVTSGALAVSAAVLATAQGPTTLVLGLAGIAALVAVLAWRQTG